MEEITLNRTGKPPLRFNGERIAFADGHEIKTEWDRRWHQIAVYRTAKGRLVCSIAYRADEKFRKEPPHDRVEVFDDPKALADFLVEYDPTEQMLGYPPKQQYEEQQRQERVKAANQWGTLVGVVLQQAKIVDTLE